MAAWDDYLAQNSVAPQPLVDDQELVNIAASNGASSGKWYMTYAVACMKARRMAYHRVTAGDCGTNRTDIPGATKYEALVGTGLGSAAAIDPEPISKGILTGVSAILGGFTAHHAQAVQTEENVGCAVTTSFNQSIESMEMAVEQGVMTPNQATALLQQITAQLIASLSPIVKTGNLGYGMRITLNAMLQFFSEIAFNLLAPAPGTVLSPSQIPAAVASAGAPGTYSVQGSINTPLPGYYPSAPSQSPYYPVPSGFPGAPSTYQGASGALNSPFNANNAGLGPSSLPTPVGLTPGTILIIGGVAFVASEI